jgi:hypothetical protein
MIFDINKIQLASNNSSLKMIKSGTGTLDVPGLGGAGLTANTAVIPHGYGSDALIVQVWSSLGFSSSGGMLPFQTPDGGVIAIVRVDATNLYIKIYHNSSFSAMDPRSYTYSYRILVP